MLVPVGIAYALASGVPGIYGLYATIVPLLAYALFGPSRILVLGPDSSLAPVILAVVLPLSGGDAMQLDRRAEWRQIYFECWRQMRDFFFSPTMDGVDWKAVRDKYSALLPFVNHRNDLTYLLGELIGELNIGQDRKSVV